MIHIIQMEKSHLDEAMAIEEQCFCDPWSRKMLASEIENPAAIYYSAYDDNKTYAGYAGMVQILDEGHIHNVAVSKSHRRKGFARALIQMLIKHAAENGVKYLLLEVRAGNDAAIALYESLDFKKLTTRPNYYKNPNEDALVMILELNLGRQRE